MIMADNQTPTEGNRPDKQADGNPCLTRARHKSNDAAVFDEPEQRRVRDRAENIQAQNEA